MPRYSYSYPSEHAAFGAIAAILLADIVPERRTALFSRGWEYGESGVIAGMHYPSDVETGRYSAMALVAVMTRNRQFREDFTAARSELRKAMSLSPSPEL